MDLQAIQAFLAENKDKPEVQTFVKGLAKDNFSLDLVKDFVKDGEGKKWLQSETDRVTTKGIETWKQNNLDGIVDAKIKELYPDESEDSKLLKKLQADLDAEKQARVREGLRNKALSTASEKNLPTNLVDFFLGQDEESTVANLTAFEQTFQQAIQAQVEGKFKQNGYNPKPPASGTAFTKEQLSGMSEAEINANWDAISKQMAEGTL